MREIHADQLEQVLTADTQLVDVREPREYVQGHVPGAVLIPMGQLTARMAELDRTAPVHVICASGNRSGAMVHLLAAGGFDAVNVAGGMSAWARSGRPVAAGRR